MHICMLTSAAFPPREGMGYYIWNLARFLIKSGHQVQIITRGSFSPTSHEIVSGIAVWRLPFLPLYPIHVHLHSFFVNQLLLYLEPTLDLLHIHTPLVRYPYSQLASLVTVHTPMKADSESIAANSLQGILVKLQVPVSIRLEQGIFSQARLITAVSYSVSQELEPYGIDPGKVRVLGNGADTNIFCPGRSNLDPETSYILTVCRLGPRKGLDDLLACARLMVNHIPDLRIYLAGDGPQNGRIKRAIQSLNLTDNVILLGHIADQQQLTDLYRGAAVFVHPAHYEGLPTVLLEAMACSRPVVSTAVSGALDVIEDGKNGLLIPPHAPDQMAHAILRVLKDPGFGQLLGVAARETIERRYSWSLISQAYIDHYRNLLNESST